MDKFIVEGGNRLEGELEISGAKNAALPMMAASILTTGINKFSGIPQVRYVNTMLHRGLAPMAHPPGSETLALPKRARSGPNTRHDARIVETRS